MPRLSAAATGLLLATFLFAETGCHAPERSDAFIAEDASWSKRGAGGTILLYLPNRVLDVLDILHVGVGVGPGAGLGLHFTRYGRLLAVAAVDVGIGWFGRHARPYQAAVYARGAVGMIDALAAAEPARFWHVPKWDIGAYTHGWAAHLYAGIAPDEILDFLAGLITFDTKGDDW